MQRKTKTVREYRFEIDAYTPATIPLSRLSQYLSDLARMMGESASVHLSRVEKGSTVPIILVDWEAEPKVRERLRLVKFKEGPKEAQDVYKRQLIEGRSASRTPCSSTPPQRSKTAEPQIAHDTSSCLLYTSRCV